MKKIFLNLLLFIATIGWLVPAGFSLAIFNDWVWNDVFPIIYSKKEEINSFPFYQASESFAQLAFWWFGIVFIGWSTYLILYKPLRANKNGS